MRNLALGIRKHLRKGAIELGLGQGSSRGLVTLHAHSQSLLGMPAALADASSWGRWGLRGGNVFI